VYCTYVVNGINEWVVTAVTHGKPIKAKPYDIDIRVPETRQTIRNFCK